MDSIAEEGHGIVGVCGSAGFGQKFRQKACIQNPRERQFGMG